MNTCSTRILDSILIFANNDGSNNILNFMLLIVINRDPN